ncbi:MAG: ribonuclease R [Bacteroidaceae bacterium]|nr:ribonuclease R [Bacteroidaceae bacterium]
MMAKKGGKATRRMDKRQLVEMIVEFFNRHDSEQVGTKEIFKALGITSTSARTLCVTILDDMVFDGYLLEPAFRKYMLANRATVVCGTFKRSNEGYNMVYPEDGSDAVIITERHSLHALTDDYVRATIFAKRRGGALEGEVVEIMRRKHDTFAGVLKVEKHYALLLTESKIIPNDIFIPREYLKGGKSGDKAVVKLLDWPLDSRNPVGKVVDILGKEGDNDAEMNAILVEYGLPYVYPAAVEEAANRLPSDITEQEIARREDFRGITTFTIDPVDAKDFDDALSIRTLPDGLLEIGVHIADVSHYVTEGSVIDKEAFKRATSIYLVDRTIPMLPERLCNFLCSLRPNEDKLTYSVIFTMNSSAEVKKFRIVRGVINSDRRFSYEEVQDILTSGEGEYCNEIRQLNDLAQIMRTKRFAAGAIDFQQAEVRFRLDDDGKPLSVYFSESDESHQLIEEFMLLANRTVAETIGKRTPNNQPKTFVYRIHDTPDPDKLTTLARFVAKLGYKMKSASGRTTSPAALNNLLGAIKGTKEQNVIEQISLRTMQKAKYSTENIGHYGLAFKYYTHFTSPIRRYPDLLVHRLLDRYLAQKARSVSQAKYEDFCEHCSAQEQVAANAERASIKYKQVEFMSEHVGEEYDAVISGVTEWGIYAEINENKCEGMIPLRTLQDDFYEFDDANYCLVGKRKHRKYMIGDPLRIRITRANLERKQLDFELAEGNG